MTDCKETEIGVVPIEWEVKKVQELVDESILAKPLDGNHGSIHPKYSDYIDFGVPFIMAADIMNGSIDFEGCKFISEEKAKTLRKGFAKAGDVLLTHKATLGRTAIVPEHDFPILMLTPQVTYYRVIDPTKLNNKYLKYYFDSSAFQNTLLNYASSGSTRNYLGITAQRDLPILLPPIEEQESISAVLDSLDQKLMLLNKQNKILKDLAEVLFREWFIENPNEEWEERSLDKIADYLNGVACQKYPPSNEEEKLPVLKIKELRGGISENSDWASTDVPSKFIIRNGDIIFSWSGSLMVKIWDGEKCILNQHLFKVTSGKYPKWFYYLWTKHHLDQFVAIAESKATTMGHIKRKDLSISKVLVPSSNEFEEMDRQLSPLIEKIILNNRNILNLSKLRDTLLSKLIIGEVRVI